MPGDPQAATVGRILFVSAPIVVGVVLTLLIGGLYLASRQPRPATGVRAELLARSACPSEWAEVMRARAELIGIGELSVAVEGQAVALRGVMPGLDDDLSAVPALLTAPARFGAYVADSPEARPEGEPILGREDLESVYFQLDLMGHPFVQVELTPTAAARVAEAAPPALLFVLDGQVIDTWSDGRFSGSKLQLQPERETSREEVRVTTDWSILLSGREGPCPIDGVEARALPPGL